MTKRPYTYTLRIVGTSPDSLPLSRLADYLEELAKLAGEEQRVHFDKVVKGSAAIRFWAEEPVAQSVSKRVVAAAKGLEGAPKEAASALAKINALLAQDGRRGELKGPDNAVIYPFPGKSGSEEEVMTVEDQTTVAGQVIRIGGRDDTIPMLLVDADGNDCHCTVKGKELARDIATYYLGDPIEVSGKGKWRRSAEGRWVLESLIVDSWSPLSTDWDAAYGLMSRITAEWQHNGDVMERCAEIRRG